jgi:hypothetical protein
MEGSVEIAECENRVSFFTRFEIPVNSPPRILFIRFIRTMIHGHGHRGVGCINPEQGIQHAQ